jgi:hypothetical protein
MASLSAPDVRLFLEARMAHRARWVLDHDLSDAELAYLATGELGGRE